MALLMRVVVVRTRFPSQDLFIGRKKYLPVFRVVKKIVAKSRNNKTFHRKCSTHSSHLYSIVFVNLNRFDLE